MSESWPSEKSMELIELVLSELRDEQHLNDHHQEVFFTTFRTVHRFKDAAEICGNRSLYDYLQRLETRLLQMNREEPFTKDDQVVLLEAFQAIEKHVKTGQALPEKLELSPDQQNVPNVAKSEASEAPLGTIFIIDDEEDILELLDELVQSLNFKTKTFNRPEDALNAFETCPPDLVLSDMSMPNLTGLDLLKAVHRIAPDLPVIFVSGHLDKAALIEGVNYGLYGAIEKPYDSTQLSLMCINATKRYRVARLLNQMAEYVIYNHAFLDEFLKTRGEESLRNAMNLEIESLLNEKAQIKKMKSTA